MPPLEGLFEGRPLELGVGSGFTAEEFGILPSDGLQNKRNL